MKPSWSEPHTHSNPTNLALFGHKITLYTFNQGGLVLLQVGSNRSRGAEPLWPPLTLTTGNSRVGDAVMVDIVRGRALGCESRATLVEGCRPVGDRIGDTAVRTASCSSETTAEIHKYTHVRLLLQRRPINQSTFVSAISRGRIGGA